MSLSEDAKERFENSSKYRRDKKDGRYFPYDFNPGGQPLQGLIFQTVDKDFRILYIPHNVDEKMVSKEKENVFTELERLDPESEGFRRDEMFWIHHSDGEDDHLIKIVIEQRSHEVGDEMISPHLNWKGENDHSEKEDYIDCKKCRNYFEFINHIELEFDIIDEDFKRANWEDTLAKFCEEIRDSKFYEENEVEDLVDL